MTELEVESFALPMRRARAELEAAGYNTDPDKIVVGDPFSRLGIGIMNVMSAFYAMHLSGGIAPMVVPIITALMKGQTILPLTGADDEWELVDPAFADRDDWYQNKRASNIFKDGKNGQAYASGIRVFQYPYTDEEGNSRMSAFTCPMSSEYIEFPYKEQDPMYVNLPSDDYDLALDPLNLIQGKRATETKLRMIEDRIKEAEAIRIRAETPAESITDSGVRKLLDTAMSDAKDKACVEALLNGAPYEVEVSPVQEDGSLVVDIYVGQSALELKAEKNPVADHSFAGYLPNAGVDFSKLSLSSGQTVSAMTEAQHKELDGAIEVLRSIVASRYCARPSGANILTPVAVPDTDIIYAVDPTAGAGDTTYLSPSAFSKIVDDVKATQPTQEMVDLMSGPELEQGPDL